MFSVLDQVSLYFSYICCVNPNQTEVENLKALDSNVEHELEETMMLTRKLVGLVLRKFSVLRLTKKDRKRGRERGGLWLRSRLRKLFKFCYH